MGVASPDAVDPAPTSSFRPLQAIVALGGIQALTMLAGLARTKVLAVLLGPAGVGIASVIDQVESLVAQLGSLSIPFVGGILRCLLYELTARAAYISHRRHACEGRHA